MSTINNNWYNLNSTRRYPVDDESTGTGDNGERLPNDIIVDAQVRFPDTLCQRAAVSSLVVTPLLVSVTLVGVPVSGTAFIPLGVVTVPAPIDVNRPYPISPMVNGVGGYIVFGDGIDTPFKGRFSTFGQAILLPKCARAYRAVPVVSVAKLGSVITLDGIVNLKSGTDIDLSGAERQIGGRNRTVIVASLKTDTTANLLDTYRGPCSGRPESNTCARPAVQFINTVGPDCSGNINLEFASPVQVSTFDGGIALDYTYGLIDACTQQDALPTSDGVLPNEYVDDCNPSDTNQDANAVPGPVQPISDVPINQPTTSMTSSSIVMVCASLPHTEYWNHDIPASFQTIYGSFGIEPDDSPAEDQPGSFALVEHHRQWSSSYGPSSSSSFGSEWLEAVEVGSTVASLRAQSTTGRNLILWTDCAYSEVLNLSITTDILFPASLGVGNGGIVLNFRTNFSDTGQEYWIVELDRSTAKLRIRWWTGSSWAVITTSSPVSVNYDTWYRLTVAVTNSSGLALLDASLLSVPDLSVVASLSTTIAGFFPAEGKVGLATENSGADFSYFKVEEI